MYFSELWFFILAFNILIKNITIIITLTGWLIQLSTIHVSIPFNLDVCIQIFDEFGIQLVVNNLRLQDIIGFDVGCVRIDHLDILHAAKHRKYVLKVIFVNVNTWFKEIYLKG